MSTAASTQQSAHHRRPPDFLRALDRAYSRLTVLRELASAKGCQDPGEVAFWGGVSTLLKETITDLCEIENAAYREADKVEALERVAKIGLRARLITVLRELAKAKRCPGRVAHQGDAMKGPLAGIPSSIGTKRNFSSVLRRTPRSHKSGPKSRGNREVNG
jgi:hypothetical protein